MTTFNDVVSALRAPGVTEVVLTTGRAAAAVMGGKYSPLGNRPLSNPDILQFLRETSASAPSSISDEPAEWSVPVDGFGAILVTAVRRGDEVQAKLVKGELGKTKRPAAPAAKAEGKSSGGAWSPPSQAPVGSASSGSASAAPAQAKMSAPPRSAAPMGEGLRKLLAAAEARSASDLHIISTRPLLYRIAGELVPQATTLSHSEVEKLILPEVPARLRPQLDADGSCDFALEQPSGGRYRVNVSRQRTGLKACLRLIPKTVPTLSSLGLPVVIGEATHHHQGLILITGASGHGKTSTLAAIVDIINTETTHHVITVEDPVEYVFPRKRAMISQREVGTHTRSFQSALKASLREDPDVIVVGELRDTETVRMALAAGETGHLLIATMNTTNAAKTIERLIDLFPPGDQAQVRMTLSTGLRMIVSQRLVPTVDRTKLVAAVEVLPGSVPLANLIREDKTYQIPSLQQRGKGAGILRIDDSLAELVHQGKITIETAREYADAPEELPAAIAALKPAPPPAPSPPSAAKRITGLFKKADS